MICSVWLMILSLRYIATEGRLVEGALRRMVSAWVRSWDVGRIYVGVVVVMCTCPEGRLELVKDSPLSHIVSVGERMGWLIW